MICESSSSTTATHAVTLILSYGTPDCGDLRHAGLTEREQCQAARFRDTGRRNSFVTGRLLAKRAVALCLSSDDPSAFEIRSSSTDQSSSQPIAYREERPLQVCVSIAHIESLVAVAATQNSSGVGVDLTPIQLPSRAFQNLWMTEDERSVIVGSPDPALAAAKNWSAREAAFKLAQTDTVFRPADWTVRYDGECCECLYRGQSLSIRADFLRLAGNTLLAVASRNPNAGFLRLESPFPVEDISNHFVFC